MSNGAATGFVPTTDRGKQHENLPTLHVDGGLTFIRSIEGIQLDGGLKVVRLMPYVPSAPAFSGSLVAHAVCCCEARVPTDSSRRLAA
eukprot:7378287-Prymnesium_polylepis.1